MKFSSNLTPVGPTESYAIVRLYDHEFCDKTVHVNYVKCFPMSLCFLNLHVGANGTAPKLIFEPPRGKTNNVVSEQV